MRQFFPPVSVLAEVLGVPAEALSKPGRISVPANLLRFLIKLAVENTHVDPEIYLSQNPDLAAAFKDNDKSALKSHYSVSGYFEQRALPVAFDEKYYLRRYSDVRSAVDAKKVQSGQQHFSNTGYFEIRAPNAEAEVCAAEWRAVLAIARSAKS